MFSSLGTWTGRRGASDVFLPCVAVDAEDGLLLLDGCHRCAAVYLSGAEFTVLFYVMSLNTKTIAAVFDA